MAVDISFQTNSKLLSKKISKYFKSVPGLTTKGLKVSAFLLKKLILERTKKGKGLFGTFASSAPYSKAYIKYLKSIGAPTVIDLRLTGDMLGSIQTKLINKRKAQVFFGRKTEEEKAAKHQKTRPFFGFTRPREEKFIQKQFIKYVERELRKRKPR
jgi:hypothetical protein